MRIIQLVHTSIQFEPPVFALGKALASRGHDVTCVGYWLPDLPYEQRESTGYSLIRIPRGDFRKLPRLFRGGLRIARYWKGVHDIACTLNPDLVISFGYDVLPVAFHIAPSRKRIIYYCTEYSPKPRLQQYITGWGFLKRAERRYVQSVGTLISVEPNRARLQELEWDRSIDHIILNAPLFDSALERLAASQISHTCNAVRLVYAGSIGARNCLIELMQTVLEVPEVSLTIYGRVVSDFQEPFQTALQSISTMSNGRVQYHGPVGYDSLARLLTKYDLGVSFYDGKDINTQLASPAKLFEYMRAGLAILSTPQPTPRQIIQDSKSGILVDLSVSNSLSKVLRDLVQRPEFLKQTRLNALQAFRHRYAYERQANVLLDRIERMGKA